MDGMPGGANARASLTPSNTTRLRRDLVLTYLLLTVTLAAAAMMYLHIGAIGVDYAHIGDSAGVAMQVVFGLVVMTLVYSYCVYLVCRVGQLQRRRHHVAASRAQLEALLASEIPALAVLVPSYKEEIAVVRRTLLSAGLQEYPRRRVVLLIDDPPTPTDLDDGAKLETMRLLPRELQALFDDPAERCDVARRRFYDRCRRSFDGRMECRLLADSYEEAAAWFQCEIMRHSIVDHADRLFVAEVLQRWRVAHQESALRLRGLADSGGLDHAAAVREYERLATLFRVSFTSFERKLYANLSHQPNKAMNLNSYIALMGRSFRRERRGEDLLLREQPSSPGTFDVPDAELLLTLDADSVIVPEYTLRLAQLMLQPGNARIAVAQTPYSAFPGAPGELERIAGATTDVQYLIHQGFTRHNATFWVGANALLRKAALEDIATEYEERGYRIRKYIHDRTVIEDTESSIDLAARGWTLVNYPERMAYSATPTDFGSLLIQRCRWANGGLLILPKALRHLLSGPRAWRKLPEAFCRIHYLTSLATANLAVPMILSGVFERNLRSPWLFVCSLPAMLLYLRDLRYCGYRGSDFLRVYVLNVLLLPVHLGGVLRSLRQAATGRQTQFRRTPKVIGRTAAPAGYILAEYGLWAATAAIFVLDLMSYRWMSAAGAFTYLLCSTYSLVRYVGLRNAAEDLGLLRPGGAVAPAWAAAEVPRSQSPLAYAPMRGAKAERAEGERYDAA